MKINFAKAYVRNMEQSNQHLAPSWITEIKNWFQTN